MPQAGNSTNPEDWSVESVIEGMGYYNGPGNLQCQYQSLTNYSSCPPLFDGEDHTYVTNLLGPKYVNMALIYPLDGTDANEFCSNICPVEEYDLCSACPPPIEWIKAGSFTFSVLIHEVFLSGISL